MSTHNDQTKVEFLHSSRKDYAQISGLDHYPDFHIFRPAIAAKVRHEPCQLAPGIVAGRLKWQGLDQVVGCRVDTVKKIQLRLVTACYSQRIAEGPCRTLGKVRSQENAASGHLIVGRWLRQFRN